MNKWVCIKSGLKSAKEGEIYEGGLVRFGLEPDESQIFCYITEGYRNYVKFHLRYFIPYEKWLAEHREEQIKTILDD